VFLGWFTDFNVTESSSSPYQFTMSANFEVSQEIQTWRTALTTSNPFAL